MIHFIERHFEKPLLRLGPDGVACWLSTPFLILVTDELHLALQIFPGDRLPLYGTVASSPRHRVYVYAWRPFHLPLRLVWFLWERRWFLHHLAWRFGFYEVEEGELYSSGRWTRRKRK